jgi:hypothetical protein
MASKRSKSNRGRFVGRRRAKGVELEIEDVRGIDAKRSPDECWQWLESTAFQEIQGMKASS